MRERKKWKIDQLQASQMRDKKMVNVYPHMSIKTRERREKHENKSPRGIGDDEVLQNYSVGEVGQVCGRNGLYNAPRNQQRRGC